jgi:8-oxo-dGTP pyrophosphatase MutT (NUDIX family)
MADSAPPQPKIIQRVRAILLAEQRCALFIKRVKPSGAPYWVAPGGGVEDHDESLYQTLHRELMEELGATAQVLSTAFVLRHHKAGKELEEHFFICKLTNLNLGLRNGPEFNRPERGLYLPDFIPLEAQAIQSINILTEELRDWLLSHLDDLQQLAG